MKKILQRKNGRLLMEKEGFSVTMTKEVSDLFSGVDPQLIDFRINGKSGGSIDLDVAIHYSSEEKSIPSPESAAAAIAHVDGSVFKEVIL